MGVSSRRFDTDAVLQLIMEGDKAAFESFYERYRGRVYRFIVRLYGTGDFGKAAYYAAWRHLVISSRNSTTPKELKFGFFQNLGRSTQVSPQRKQSESTSSYLPRDIEEDGKWSLIFIEQFRRLPESMKKRFLFKHELGLSLNAVARIFDDRRKHIEKAIEEAEHMLRLHMDEAGCPEKISVDQLYRESRIVKPPSTWDGEILDSFAMWQKQSAEPYFHPAGEDTSEPEPEEGLGAKLGGWMSSVRKTVNELKSKTGGKGKKSKASPRRR